MRDYVLLHPHSFKRKRGIVRERERERERGGDRKRKRESFFRMRDRLENSQRE